MFSIEEHLDDLIRHIELVREACILLGRRIITRGEEGDEQFGRDLIARGMVHDASKFTGIEWDYLHNGPDIDEEKVKEAIQHHVETNDHHPEHWGGIENMPPIAVAEMVCDWKARSAEFGTDLRAWIKKNACKKYKIEKNSKQFECMNEYVDLLLQNAFVKK